MKIRRVLYISSSIACMGSAMLYHGLCEVLGSYNVVDYQFNELYHGNPPDPWWPRKYGIEYSKDEILSIINSFDIIVLATVRIDAFESLMELIKEGVNLPIIVNDEEDYDYVNHGVLSIIKPLIHFKREINFRYVKGSEGDTYLHVDPRQRGASATAIPLTFSVPEEIVYQASNERDIDIFVAFWQNHVDRLTAVNRIKTLDNKYNIDITFEPGRLSYNEYMSRMRRSKVSVSIRGFSWDTVRLHESIASGAAVVSSRPDMIMSPEPYKNGEHFVCVDPGDANFLEAIVGLLENDGLRNDMTKVAREHLLKYHTTTRRARWFLDTIERRL